MLTYLLIYVITSVLNYIVGLIFRVGILCENDCKEKMSVSMFLLFHYDFRVIVRHFLLGRVCVVGGQVHNAYILCVA